MKIICDQCDDAWSKVLLRNREHPGGAVIGVDREMLLDLQTGDDPFDGDTDELVCPCGAVYRRREFLELEVA